MKQSKGNVLYYEVKNQLLHSIQHGKYREGDQLPTEAELCQEYQVSRTTIRLALQQLELDGWVQRRQGKGTFVSRPALVESYRNNFTNLISQHGRQPKTVVLSFEIIPAAPPLEELLKLSNQDPIFRFTRLRLADDEPLHFITSYVPWSVAPGLSQEELTGSLFQLLRTKFHVEISKALDSIHAVASDKTISPHLEIAVGTPVLYIESLNMDADHRPVEYSKGFMRTKFQLEHNYTTL